MFCWFLFSNSLSRLARTAEENTMSQEVLSIKSDPPKVVAKSCWEIQRDGGGRGGGSHSSGQTNNKQDHNIFIYFHNYSLLHTTARHGCRQMIQIKSSANSGQDKVPNLIRQQNARIAVKLLRSNCSRADLT